VAPLGAAVGAARGAGEHAVAGAGAPAVRIEDPLALFVPERFLVGTVPLPLYLLELVPGSVKADYERTATGTVAHEGDRIRRRTVRYPGGVRVDIEVHGDQVRGLPTTFDYDYFLALCRIADEGGVDAQGYFVDPGYRAVLRAAGRSDTAIGGEQVEAVKRAFARFGGLILYTRLDVDYSDRSALVRAGTRHPLVPDGAPPVREREGKHWVLEYDVEAERRRDASYNSIERLRINPLWLDQAAAGIAAWMDVELHNRLRSGYAKRLLQLFTVRAARGWRVFDPWVLDLRELYDLLEVPPAQWGKSQTRTGVAAALQTLVEHGVLGEGVVERQGKGRYELRLAAGERLLAAGYQRGTGGSDGVADRMLLWHLRALGFGAPQARELVRTRPDQVRTVLRRVYYLQAHKGGLSNGRPVEDWGAWTRAAVEGDYAFSDPEWQRWLARQLEAGQRGVWGDGEAPRPALVAVAPGGGGAGEGRRVIVTPAAPPASDPPGTVGDAFRRRARARGALPRQPVGSGARALRGRRARARARLRDVARQNLARQRHRLGGHGGGGGRVHGRVDRAEVPRSAHRAAVRRRRAAGGAHGARRGAGARRRPWRRPEPAGPLRPRRDRLSPGGIASPGGSASVAARVVVVF
jgi:hypothetical protein